MANQRAVLEAGFRLLETGTTPGEIVDQSFVWSEDDSWKRLVFTQNRAFMTPEAEAHRQNDLSVVLEEKQKRLERHGRVHQGRQELNDLGVSPPREPDAQGEGATPSQPLQLKLVDCW